MGGQAEMATMPATRVPGKRVFVHSPVFGRIAYPPDCPFNTVRAGRVLSLIESMGLLAGDDRRTVEAEALPRDRLAAFHTPRYLDLLAGVNPGNFGVEALAAGLGTGDNPIFPGLFEYAATACGATVLATELVLDGKAGVAFNLSGGYHHAQPDRASGFCYLNDVALGCLRLAAAGQRVAYLDIDVHHGDGVQQAFYRRRDVLTISLHESGHSLFPGTGFPDEIGEGEGRGYSVNLPFPPGTYDEAYLRAYQAVVPPLLAAFAPDVIVLEAGADTLNGDPLAHLRLTNNVPARILADLLELGPPLVVAGGGGYHVENTVRAWARLWSVACDDDPGAEAMAGMGGVFLQNTELLAGLRDRELARPHAPEASAVEAAIDEAVAAVRKLVFPCHGL